MFKSPAENWQQVKKILTEAMSLDMTQRRALLDRECSGNDALRAEVESLLKSYEAAESFMESPAVHAAAKSFLGKHHGLAVGQAVAHYEIVAPIGEGGMGDVYLAGDTRLGRRVALKILPEDFASDPLRLRRFKQEARAASALNHPNVCVIHEVGETEDHRPFIAMEYIEGVTLRQHASGPLKLAEALDLAIQVADALVAAHGAGIVHRDIKPENIMLRPDGYVKVLDFGLAKVTERPKRDLDTAAASTLLFSSTPGLVLGTVAYMSPEQARGIDVDARTDIWSLGVVIYEMITGQAPFDGDTPTDVVVCIIEREQAPLAQLTEYVPAELERIVRKALRKDREERYQLIKEMAIDLRSLRRELLVDSELERSVAPVLTRGGTTATGKAALATRQMVTQRDTGNIRVPAFSRGSRLPLLLIALLVVSALAVGAYKYLNRSPVAARLPQPFQHYSVMKLTTNGNATLAAISPDGRYVAYVMNETGKQSLWLRQVAVASNAQIVSPRAGHYLGIVFSPDGDYLFYGYSETSQNHGDVYRIPVLAMGGAAMKLSLENGPFQLSHDGRRRAFLRYESNSQSDYLILTNADGGDERKLLARKWPERLGWGWETTPVWTTNDQELIVPVVAEEGGGNYSVILVTVRLADGSEKKTPVSALRFEQPSSVSVVPGGEAVIVSARAQGESFSQIWYLSRDNTARRITNDLNDYHEARFSANAGALVTVQTQTLSNIWTTARGEPTKPRPLTSGVGRYFDLVWTPDGQIIYASDASGSADIYEMEADGSHVRQLTSNAKRNYAPAVSADGRYVAFHSDRSGSFQIWRMDRDGSNPVQLTQEKAECNWPQFTPDGEWVIYQHYDSGVAGTLWKVPVNGGTPSRITDGLATRPVISPDGQSIGCWFSEGKGDSPWQVGIIPIAGGKPAKIFAIPPSAAVRWDSLLRWSADGKNVTYVDHRAGVDNIWSQPIEGGAPRQVTDFKDSEIFSFDWLRDGRLVTSRGVITRDVLLLTDAR